MGSESKRQQKFARLIQKDLGDIFHRELQHMLPNAMITITMVRATPDLSGVKVYLSFYNAPDVKEAMNTIKLHTADIRYRRSEEHTSELQSLMRISYAVFCLKKKNKQNIINKIQQ